ncbi:hypothetical protein FACS1894111_02460 [Clostridia bacterium]|nr:hypothetical protein FACS1894111_02460 [Clostridia bacterium]
MNEIKTPFTSIEQVRGQYLTPTRKVSANTATESFQDILLRKQSETGDVSPLKFSKHAALRLESRNIELSPQQRQRLDQGAQKAQEKGIKESLVVVDSLAFIVNIPNKTVVTAMDQKESMENIYTNIDGAVII